MCVGLCRAGKWTNRKFIEQTIDKNKFVVTAQNCILSLRTFNTGNDHTEYIQRDYKSRRIRIEEFYF